MNFSPPLSFQQQMNYPNPYNPNPQYFPPGASPINNPMQHQIFPGQDKQQRAYQPQIEDFSQMNSIKKLKPSWNGDMSYEALQGRMINTMQQNEPIRNPDMTSLINNNTPINQLNYYEQMMRAGNRQIPGMELFQNRDPKEMAALLGNQMNPTQYLNALNQLEQRQMLSLQNEQMMLQEQALQQQLRMLQELQNPIMNAQSQLEQLYMQGNLNPAMLNQLYNNENMAMLQQMQNEQMKRKMIEEAQKAEELKRQYAELAMGRIPQGMNSMNPMEAFQRQAQMTELNEMSQFPLGHSMSYNMHDILSQEMLSKLNSMENVKGGDIHELEGKKTPETSLPTSIVDDSAIKELHDNSMPEFHLDQQLQQRLANSNRRSMHEPKSLQESPMNETRRKNTDETLLKKRKLENMIYEQELNKQKESSNRASPVKPLDRASRAHKLGGLVKAQDDRNSDTLSDPFDPTYTEKTGSSKSVKNSTQKPLIKPQISKEKPRLTPTLEEFNKAPKTERRMNKLQSMRMAMEDYLLEQKKPYTINIHINPADTEEKIVFTKLGSPFQVPVAPWDANRRNVGVPRVPKISWDPSSISDEKMEELQNEMTKIFGQDVTNQESALRILRGSGMNVESTLEIMKNNNGYFKAILFPEPKPLKAQRTI